MDYYMKMQSQDPFTYTDSAGRMKLKSNNKIVYDFTAPWNGHVYIRDKKGNFLFDKTEEEAKLTAGKNPGEAVEYTETQVGGHTIKRYIRQKKDGQIGYYTIMHYKDADIIVNLDGMKAERPTNEQLRFELNCRHRGLLSYSEEGFREMMRDFNLKDRIERESIIGEYNTQVHKGGGSYWNEVLYKSREPAKQWSYFKRNDRGWIK